MPDTKPLAFAGFLPPQANYYRLPNQWFDIWAQVRKLLEAQGTRLSRSDGLLKLLEYLIKYTWGYLNFEEPVRLTFDEFTCGRRRASSGGGRGKRMDQGTGLSSASIKKNIDRLLALGLIQKIEDNGDKARIRCWYAPRIASERNPETEPGQIDLSCFAGFDRPNTNYFPVPFEWTNLSRQIGSAVAILCVEYLMRHTFGWQDEIRWLTPTEIASGRRKRDGTIYDDGIQYSRDAVASACEWLVGQGILVSRGVRRDAGRESREYALRMREMGNGHNKDRDPGLGDDPPSVTQPAPGDTNEALTGQNEVLDRQTRALTGETKALTRQTKALTGETKALNPQSKARSGNNTPEQNNPQNNGPQPSPAPHPVSPADDGDVSMSLSPEAQVHLPHNPKMGEQAFSSRPNGSQSACSEELTRTEVLEWLDRLRIFEPTRSRLAKLVWVSNAGYLQSWAAWYGSQSACGVGWVIRQIEAGLQAPVCQENRCSEWGAQHGGDRTTNADTLVEFQETDCCGQDAGPGNTQESTVQPCHDLWGQALSELRSQMTGASFDTWLATSRALDRQDERLVVGVRNQYAKEWLDVRFRPVVLRILAGIDSTISLVEFRVLGNEETVGNVEIAP